MTRGGGKTEVSSTLVYIKWCSISLLAGGYWGFHRGKPVPFGNRAPSWIFEARAPGYERASAKIEGSGEREGREKPPVFLPSPLSPPPSPLPSLTLSTLYPAQTWPREFKMATSLRIPVFFDHPTACRLMQHESIGWKD